MRTLYALPQEKQIATAHETLQIFAPLAHRLGVWRFKWELEDLALRYLEPETYYEIAHLLGAGRGEREERIEAVRTAVRGRLEQEGIRATVQGRAKHIYSIAQKMEKEDISFDRIADLAAIRIITDSVADCYAALGIVHELWIPIQGMFTDYIAKPKANKYQSLHTKVIGRTSSHWRCSCAHGTCTGSRVWSRRSLALQGGRRRCARLRNRSRCCGRCSSLRPT
jgi:guanosine-3',5'-bis(diphosphate) 3'-pyrophosphohydrolase